MSRVAAPPSPFKGLAPFDESDADALFFFGRARETEVIAANLQASRLTVLYGPSGVGKSSVLRAGVAHRLRAEPGVLVAIVDTWAGDPLATILHALAGDDDGSLAGALDAAAARVGGDVYLILDQFEEYFLYHQEDDVLSAELAEVVARRGLAANVLIGIREDSLGRLDTFRKPISNLLANRLRLDRLDRAAARDAIEGPIARYNELVPPDQRVEVEPELVQAVLDQVATGRVDPGAATGRGSVEGDASDRVEAPYLQLVLTRLWEVEAERRSRRLRLATLEELGGAERMVERHLERAMAELSPQEKDAAAAMYHFLVTPSGTKIAHAASDLAGYAGIEEREAGAVLRRLTAERIVRASSANGAVRYEIFHDVLADAVLEWRNRHESDQALARERSEARRKHRRAVIVAAAALVALAVMAVVAIFAWTQRSHAKREARVALARELTASAFLNLDRDPELSLLLALQAERRERGAATESILRTALVRSRVRALSRVPPRAVLAGRGQTTSAAFNRAGDRVVMTSADGIARVFDATTGSLLYRIGAGHVVAASFGPSGRLFATAGADGSIRLWNASDGRALGTFPSGARLTTVRISPDSRLVAAGGGDGAVHIWNISRRIVQTVQIGAPVSTLAFSRSSGIVLVAAGDTARLFDVATGRVRATFRHRARITDAVFSANGRLVATTSLDRTARLWRADTGTRIRTIREPKGAIFAAAFSPHGKLLATASSDGAARIYDVGSGTRLVTLIGHGNFVTGVAFSPDGTSLVTASRDGTAKIWEVDTGRPIVILAGHRGPVLDAIFSENGHAVVTAGADGTARVWDPSAEPRLEPLGRHRGPVNGAEPSADGRRLVSFGNDGVVKIFRLSPPERLVVLRAGTPVASASFSRDGRFVVAAGSDGVARVWRVDDGKLLRKLKHGLPLATARFSPDGRLVLTAARRGSVVLWSWPTGQRRRVLRAGVRIGDAEFSPDGALIVTAGRHGSALLWDAETGTVRARLRGHHGTVVTARFSPTGRMIATAGADRTARLWDRQGRLLATLRRHAAPLTDVEFDPDGRLVVTSSLDHDAIVWDVAGARAPRVLSGHFGVVSGASFSADSRWVVTAGPGSAAVWETRSGERLFYLRGHTRVLTRALFAGNGRTVVTASRDGTVRTYFCDVCGDVDELVSLARRRLARTGRTLTSGERSRYLGGD